MKVIESRKINQRTILITLDGSIPAIPGQFAMVWLPGIGEKPYSLAGVDPVHLLIVDAGLFSHHAQGLKPGDPLWLRGPLGQGFHLQGKSCLLVAGGYGAAPLAFLAGLARIAGMKVDVCIGAKSRDDLLFLDELTKTGATVRVATEDGSQGEKGLVTDLVEAMLRGSTSAGMYACGPNGMLEKLEEIGKANNIPTQLSWEAHMRCGIGVCGSCELTHRGKGTGWLVCQDGPVKSTG